MERNLQKYKLLWRENYIDYLWATTIIAKSYFQESGILIYENDRLSAYADKKELKVIELIGENIFKKDKYKNIYLNLSENLNLIKSNKAKYSCKKITKLGNKQIYDLYIDLFNIMKKFIKYYRYTEPYYLASFENKLEDYLKTKNISPRKREYYKAKLLTSPENISNIDTDIQDISIFLNKVSKQRFLAKQANIITTEYANNLLEITAKRFNLSVTQVSNLSFRQLKNLLILSKIPDLSLSNKRRMGFKLIVQKSSFKNVKNVKVKNLAKNKFPIKGSVVYPGRVSGNVYILPPLSNKTEVRCVINSFPKNSILITSMTSPDLVPIFKKVKAIITDEGGLTSHAALIAREMKIPCIVGDRKSVV